MEIDGVIDRVVEGNEEANCLSAAFAWGAAAPGRTSVPAQSPDGRCCCAASVFCAQHHCGFATLGIVAITLFATFPLVISWSYSECSVASAVAGFTAETDSNSLQPP